MLRSNSLSGKVAAGVQETFKVTGKPGAGVKEAFEVLA